MKFFSRRFARFFNKKQCGTIRKRVATRKSAPSFEFLEDRCLLSTLYLHFDGDGLGGVETDTSGEVFAGQFKVHVDQSSAPSSPSAAAPQFISLCADLFGDIHQPDIYPVVPESTSVLLHGGEVAYLYNHFANSVSDNDHASALQIAIWELITDPVTDLSSGNYRYTQTPAIVALANNYLSAAAGQNESAIYLAPTGSLPTDGQGVLMPSTAIVTNASETANGVVGVAQLNDSATISGGVNPQGTITFTLTAPDGTTSTVGTVPVNGDGVYNAPSVLATEVGTYTWHASYSGDGLNNGAVDNGQNESVTTIKASPAINTTQQPPTAIVGGSIADKATVSGGFNPTGTVTFNLYNNPNATGPALFTDTEPLVGGMATSAGYTATATGTDYWVATYNGDSNNNAVTSGTALEPVTITPATPSINTSQQPPTATVGTSIADKAMVSGGFNPTGTVTFNLYNNPNATGPALFTDTEPLVGGMATSAGYTATATGTDYWVATYNGDSNNNAVTSGTALEPVTITAPKVSITKTADSSTVVAGQTAGFRVTIANTGTATATGLTLNDPLPPGAGNDINWMIDGSAAGTNPADFQITGPVGSQNLGLSPLFVSAGDSLAPGQTIAVHITGVTSVKDLGGSTNPALGSAGGYAVLYEGTGGHNLSITNVTINGNIGVGGTGAVQFSGPGTITGRLDFSAAKSGQFHNNNGSNVGPTSVNYSVAAVTTALNTINNLSSALAGLGNPLAISGNQTINESAGQLVTVNGINYRAFQVTSYSENDGKLVTINGDGSGNPVLFNFGFNSNVNLGGDVTLTGGLTDDMVLWNFTASGKSVSLNNNASSYRLPAAFHGIILAPNETISLVNANLDGRVFGGNSSDMQIVSGDTINAPPSTPGTLVNTATVSGSDFSSANASATITITNKVAAQLAASSSSDAAAGLSLILGSNYLRTGQIPISIDLSQGDQDGAAMTAIRNAIAALNAEVSVLGVQLVAIEGPADNAAVHLVFDSRSDIGGAAQGVLGAFADGNISLIQGWNWYFGAPGGIAPNQFDFQTVVTHELGHVLGLGESNDPGSAMYLYLGQGQVRHLLTASDLSAIQEQLPVGSQPIVDSASSRAVAMAGQPRLDVSAAVPGEVTSLVAAALPVGPNDPLCAVVSSVSPLPTVMTIWRNSSLAPEVLQSARAILFDNLWVSDAVVGTDWLVALSRIDPLDTPADGRTVAPQRRALDKEGGTDRVAVDAYFAQTTDKFDGSDDFWFDALMQ
jgi:uncharacterized repeat protein (TIGR01451 family)